MIEQKLDVRDIADRYFAAWRTRDPDAIASLHTEDTRFWMHAGTQPVVGRTAARAAFAEIFARFPDFAFEIYRVRYGTDHWVLDWALISGGRRFDCRDLVDLSPDGLVVRKDSFVDAGQIPAAAGGAGR
ncbi:hypothetical protein MKUB_13790 [Mycobacterium kubicae]|uniref:SnoaL-like domain-containing protein n=1 Tax=Mycobacterium kubicae TaxID=120959 RepID=A0ABQ1BKU9_9MYCO|nr:nuclear transport factor 2 family protein [Mycobacterium kubicae]GFG63889.1 hypothetical protein MKUB_13790 [Mycobacterium kubicae]